MHGCGWDSGAARERTAAHRLPASPRVTRLWRRDGVGAVCARAPVAAGSLPRTTRSAPKAGALRARAPTCAPPVAHALSPGGEWGCRRRCALRAAREARCKACFELLPRARVGWHTARTLCCHRLRHARAERRYGGSCGKRAARERRRRHSKVSRHRRAGHTRRRRAVGGACACRARSNGRRRTFGAGAGGWVVRTQHQLRITSGWLPLIGGSSEVHMNPSQLV